MEPRSPRVTLCLCLLSIGVLAARAVAQFPDSQLQPEEIDAWIVRLGDADYQVREAATRDLFRAGAGMADRLQERLATETDPEIAYRLRYILENLEPPRQAVLVIHAAADCGLRPGMIITHANGRPIRDRGALREQMVLTPRTTRLRVHTLDGPREVGPVAINQLNESADYVYPRGETVARALRLYSDGYAERAYELLQGCADTIPEAELTHPLLAILTYTAGYGAEALRLMSDRAEEVRAAGSDWNSPSYLDLRGPGKAPYHLEWAVATAAGPTFYASRNDPDLRVQRILIPAKRRVDALTLTAGYWWQRFRETLGQNDISDHVGGNELAVTAWMLSELQLRSECCRLIEPRSGILRRTSPTYRKWIRVDTDAWLDFLAGQPERALDGFYEDALDVLQRPPVPGDQSANTRNPEVAARIAFFLYQLPQDPRVERTLSVVQQHTHPGLPSFLDWMMFALNEQNQDVVRRDLQAALPFLLDNQATPYARAVALLEAVQRQPDLEVLRAARRRISRGTDASTPGSAYETNLALIDALIALNVGKPAEMLQLLTPFRDHPDLAALYQTAAFLADPPPGAADLAALRDPILVVPMGGTGARRLVLARDRRLMIYDTESNALAVWDKPTPSWFPNPITWPWIGREETTGRVWVYDRRRVFEVPLSPDLRAVRLNIEPALISLFQRHLAARFSRVAEAWSATDVGAGENGEFLRAEIQRNAEYVADPDLPEISVIQPVPQAPRFVYAALRGAPPILIDTETDHLWSADWIAQQLGLAAPPRFFIRPLGSQAAAEPVLMLHSDQGLIRFESVTETLTRVALPGEEPYPFVIPESVPYERRDPRYFYCARLPRDGGAVYRLTLANGVIEPVDMVNEALPEKFYALQSRAALRAEINQRFAEAGLPDLETFIRDTDDTVKRWNSEPQKQP